MAVYTETIQLKDDVSTAAKSASRALADMTGNLESARAEMFKAAALGDRDMFKKATQDVLKYGDAVGRLEEMTKGMPQETKAAEGGLSAMWANASHAAEVGKESIGAAIDSIGRSFSALASGDAKGAVTGLFDAVADLSKMLDLVVPGLGQVVSAVIKIAGGLVGITVGLIQSGMEFALAASEGKQQMLSMWDAMGDGVSTGAELDDMLSELADEIGITKDTLAPLTQEFLKMGVKGSEALRELTLAAMSANAIVGEGGAAAFTALQKKIQIAAETGGKFKLGQKQLMLLGQAGVNVSDVAQQMGKDTKELAAALEAGTVDAKEFGDALTKAVIEKGAKPLERLANTFAQIRGKFDQDIGDMFEDIDVGPFMKEVKELFAIFGQAKPSGEAMKFGIQSFFQATFDIAKKLVPMAKHFLLDMIIFGLQAYIALKPTIAALKEWLASAEGLAAQHTLWEGLKLVVVGFAAAIAVVVGAVILVTGLMVALGAAIISVTASVIDAVVGWPEAAMNAGLAFVQGLVDGITAGAQWVKDAVTGLANGAVDTFKSVLGIASPSKVGMDIGYNLGSSVGMGAEAANDVVAEGASTVAGTAAVGVASAAAPAGGAAAAAGGSGATNVFYITIEGAGKNADEIVDEIQAAAWERMALAAGA